MARRRRAGFTLTELMIVVAVIGILAAIAVPKFANLIRKSKEGSTMGGLGTAAIPNHHPDSSAVAREAR